MNFKKIFFIISFLAIFGFLFNLNAPTVKAATVEEILAKISQLQAQIAELQKQLIEMRGETWCYDFKLKLRYGDMGDEVKALQTVLTKEGFEVSGDDAGNFGEYTASALVGLQEKYRDEILTPWKLLRGTGNVGKYTIVKLNKLYGCGVLAPTAVPTTPVTPTPLPITPLPVTPVEKPALECKAVWYYDNDHQYCQQRQFCGLYMYLGLRTFSTEAECRASLASASGKYLTLISPNGGEKWVIGNTYNITWKSSGVDKVNMELAVFKDNTRLGALGIDLNIPASLGQYSWQVLNSDHIKQGNNFKIVIRNAVSPASGVSDPATLPEDESDNYFSIVAAETTNLSPVIDGLDAPTQLKINQQGTWTIKAHDPENARLNYQVRWGDEGVFASYQQMAPMPQTTVVQTTTFTHIYSNPGTYKIVFTVTDDQSKTATTSTTINVVQESLSLVCSDSDGGINYYQKGCVKMLNDPTFGSGGQKCDVCGPDNITLQEYVCENGVYKGDHSYKCPYGCQDGACIKQAQTCSQKGTSCCIGEACQAVATTCIEGTTPVFKGCGANCAPQWECQAMPAYPKSISVLSPNGGEKWEIGKTYTIQWKSDGIPTDSKTFIQLSYIEVDSTDRYEIAMFQGATNTGSYSWTIADPLGNVLPLVKLKTDQFRIRVGYSSPTTGAVEVEDYSDVTFSIVSATSQACADTDGGKDYYVKGTATAGFVSKTDFCGLTIDCPVGTDCMPAHPDILTEYYCENDTIKSEGYVCPNGCQDGVCIQQTITPTKPISLDILENQLASMAAAAQRMLDQIKKILGR